VTSDTEQPTLPAQEAGVVRTGGDRRARVRWAAPALFLLAVTVAVLAVRSALDGGKAVPAATTAPPAKTARAPRRVHHAPPARYYLVRSGDTLGSIAARTGTSVTRLEGLNPGVDPRALRVGQQLRVR